MPPYHILHLLQTSEVEGTSFARIVSALAERLDPGEYKFHAWFRCGHGPLVEMLEDRGVTVRVLDWPGGERSPRGLWSFLRGLLGQRFAVFHQHVGGRAVRLMSRYAAGARVVTHLHGRVLEQSYHTPARCNVYGADLAVATSETVAMWSGAGALVVYPGVEVGGRPPDAASRTRGPGHVLGSAGRLAPIKGMEYLIRALPVVRASVPDVVLELAGSGPEEAALRNEAQRLGLGGCVRFLGWRDAVPFDRWDVFVMPSIEEGFGIAALEAMASGLPVVASGVGGLTELVEDGRSGWLVPPADSHALAARLIPLLLDAGARREMGVAAWARAGNFTTSLMTERIERIYRRLILA